MTFTGDSTSSGNENEIQYNKSGTASDPKLTWDPSSSSLTVSGKIEQKVSNLTLTNQYALGNVKGLNFQGGSIFTTRNNDVLKLDDSGNVSLTGTLSGTSDQVINDGVEIYVLTTASDTISVLDQNLNTNSIILDSINLPRPTRFIRHGKFLFIACGSKLSKFNTTTKSVDGTFVISSDTFIDIAMKGDSLIALRQASVSEINTDTMTLVKNVPSSNIINPRRIAATRNNVFVLCSEDLLTFDTLLKYKGKRTAGLSDASCVSIYGNFLIVANNTGGLSIYDSSSIPVTLVNTIPVQVSPNNFRNSIVVGSSYYVTDSLSGNLLQFTIDGLVVGGIKAGSAQISNIETSDLSAENITTTNINTVNFYTSGSILGTSGSFGGIAIGNGTISGTNVQINSGSQSLVMDSEGFKYLNNSETVVQFKNNGTFQSSSIETGIFKISNGTNKFQISASPGLTSDQNLIFPSNGGASGNMLATDGSGNLTWRAIDPGEITIPGGFTSYVQFNTDGIFDGSSKFKYDPTTETVLIGENGEISLGHNETTMETTIVAGKASITHDSDGSRFELKNVSNVVKLVADYNDTDGATLTVGSVIIKETGISGLSAPIAGGDAATKNYVDIATGESSIGSYWKVPARAATTENITTFPPIDGITTVSTVDGVTLIVGDRVLVKDQTDASENGIYVVTVDTWARSADLNAGSSALGITLKTLEGLKHALTTWNCTAAISVGDNNDITFEKTGLGSGVSWKVSVKCATTADITTAFPPTDGITTVSEFDGITLVVGDRVLIKDQTNQIDNGIYVVTATTWERSEYFFTGAIASGNATWINQGTLYEDQGWVCVSDSAIVGTSALVFDIMSAETLPGGADTQIQFNTGGTSFGGSPDLAWDGTYMQINGGLALQDSGTNIVTLIAPSTVTNSYTLSLPPTMGTSGQVLSTNGTDSTTWENSLDLSGTSDTHLLFNNAGAFGSSANLTWNGATLKVRDDTTITVGTDNDLVISHSGTASGISSTASTFNISGTGGIITLESTSAVNGHVFIKSGTADGSSMTDFRDSAGASMLRIGGDGQIMVGVDKGYLNIRDSRNLTFGNQSDCVMSHTGAAMSLTNALGPITFTNNDATSDFTVKIGDALGTTNFAILSSASSSLLNVSSEGTVSIPGTIQTDTGVKFKETAGDDAHFVTLQAPESIIADYSLTFPVDGGSNGQFLTTDGSGAMSWAATSVDLSASADTQLLFNDTGVITGSTSLTWDGVTLKTRKIEQSSSDFYIASTVSGITDVTGIAINGDFLYVASPSTDTLRTYKTNPFNDDVPTIVSTLTDAVNLNGATLVIHNGLDLFVGSASSETASSMTSIDISDAETPAILDTFPMGSVKGLSGMVQIGGRSIVSCGENDKISITLDVSDPTILIQTRVYNAVTTSITGMDTLGHKLFYCGLGDIICSRIDNTSNGQYELPAKTYTVPDMVLARCIKVQGNYAFIGDSNGIRVIDVSKIDSMAVIATTGFAIEALGSISDLVVSGKYLYATSEANDYLQRINISDPSIPVDAGQLTIVYPNKMVLRGSYIYITSKTAGTLTKVNIGSAQLPQISSGSISTTNLIVDKDANFNGLVNISDGITVGGSVAAQGHMSASSFAVKGDLHFYDDSGSYNGYITMKAPATITPYTVTLPDAVATAGGQVLTDASGNGVLSWASAINTLQETYNVSNPADLVLDSTNNGFKIKDNSTPISDDLFTVSDNAGTTKYFNITALTMTTPSKVEFPLTGNVVFGGRLRTSGSLDIVNGDGLTTQFYNPSNGSNYHVTYKSTEISMAAGNSGNVRIGFADSLPTTTGNVIIGELQTTGSITLGNDTQTGTVTVKAPVVVKRTLAFEETGTGTDAIKIQAPDSITAGYTLTLPTVLGSVGAVLTDTNGNGILNWTVPSIATSQSAYEASTSPEIIVNSTNNAFTIQDAATPLGVNLFEVNDNTPSTVFGVTVIGATHTGTITGAILTDGVATIASGAISGVTTLGVTGAITLLETTSTTPTETISIVAPETVASTYIITLPADAGTSEQILSTDGAGVLSWVDNTIPPTKGTVTQTVSSSATVDINTKIGSITTYPLDLISHSTQVFTVTNASCLVDSVILCNINSYNGSFNLHAGVANIANGSFDVVLTNSTGGPLNDVAIIGFMIV
jgi:hypothetical protein